MYHYIAPEPCSYQNRVACGCSVSPHWPCPPASMNNKTTEDRLQHFPRPGTRPRSVSAAGPCGAVNLIQVSTLEQLTSGYFRVSLFVQMVKRSQIRTNGQGVTDHRVSNSNWNVHYIFLFLRAKPWISLMLSIRVCFHGICLIRRACSLVLPSVWPAIKNQNHILCRRHQGLFLPWWSARKGMTQALIHAILTNVLQALQSFV